MNEVTPRFGIAYFGCHDPRHIARDLREIARDFQWVCLPVTESDLRYSAGTIAQIVAAAHRVGLGVWCCPWGVAGLFGGEAISALAHLCPRTPAVQDALERWVRVVAGAGADAVLWDEPHGRCCDVWPIVGRLVALATERGLLNALCLAPERAWPSADVLGGVASIGVDPYWLPDHRQDRVDYATQWVERAEALARAVGATTHVWVQCFRVGASAEPEVGEMLEWAVRRGVPDVAIWGYRGCAVMSGLTCERPQRLWRRVTATARRLRAVP